MISDAGFDARADRYDESVVGRRFHRPVQEAVVELAARVVASPRAILDVGCGTGSLLRVAQARFPSARLTGVDASEGMIAVAAASLGEVELQRAAAERLPFAAGMFDLVLSTNSFHHWDDQVEGIAEIGRVLVSGGHVVVADPFAIGWLRPYASLIRKRADMRSRPEVEALLQDAGLRPIGWETVFRVGPAAIIGAVIAGSAG
jgi:ubiquinone/menaquinone biosynthesis C-methylase UbiE